ncbi:nebulin-related-anchoring protein isoform X2 [Synchiropus splendidus]|uniref:nebulin-related-anchoring protein isoform X2 n=1 Tax=Synchiropus splendidus TaxID=270530 RepID=UPI00237EA2DF|nr:nebulin-related-anchoring protein isoform X2 [Synchiropus splendidus]
MQACARCGFIVYPAEKINCIDQNWHKGCFHCDVCKMVLTANNFVSHNKRPYCSVHNPRNNTFTSVFETPVNINVKKKACVKVTYTEECEQLQGKGSFPAMITPGYSLAKKAQQNASDVGYRKDLETAKSHSINFCETPQFQNAAKVAKFMSDNKYRAKYTNNMKGHYEDSGIDKKTLHAMKARKLASDIKYKENYVKDKEKTTPMNVSDSKTLHSLQAAKICSNIEYKKDSKERQAQYNLPMDMIPLSHAKKAQALASDLAYRTKLHNYTIMPDDIKLQQAKKVYSMQSENKYRSDLNWMKGVSWETEGCLNIAQAKRAGELLSDNKYRQKANSIKFTQVADNLSIKHAIKSQELQSDLAYKSNMEQAIHQYTITSDDPQFRQSKANSDLLSVKIYKSNWDKQKEKGCLMNLDSLSILTAKAKRDLASDVKYKEQYERNKGKMIGTKSMWDDSRMAHSALATKLQSDCHYKKEFEDSKTKFKVSLDMLNISHAKKAQDLATQSNYRTVLHDYTTLPNDIHVTWAKKVYGLQSDKQYRSDLSWMKGVSWEASKSLDLQQAKKAGELISQVKYKEQHERNKGKKISTRSVWDDSQMAHSALATKLQSDRHYKKGFEDSKTKFRVSLDMLNISHAKKAQDLAAQSNYRTMLHDYTTLSNDIHVSWAKQVYGLQSDKKYRQDVSALKFTSVEDSPQMVRAKLSNKLAIDRLYRAKSESIRHNYTLNEKLPEVVRAKLNAAYISEKKYRQKPYQFRHTPVADSPDIVHAKLSGQLINDRLYKEKGVSDQRNYTIITGRPEITQAKINATNISEVKYKESWLTLRAKGYKVTLQDIPFQAAKSSTGIASDYNYKYNHLQEKGKYIGPKSVLDDPYMVHCQQAGRLASDQEYRKDALTSNRKYHLGNDMVNLVTAKNAQALASKQDCRNRLHEFTLLPDDMKIKWAKKAYALQSEKLYKSDLSFMKGVAWDGAGAPQLVSAKKAGELISEKNYRQLPESLKFTSVTDSPGIIHAKNSYLQCSERLYKSNTNVDMNKYTLHPDHPEFIRAKINAQQISDKVYKASGEQVKMLGCDLRFDAIPFQTAKASREIASDKNYRQLPESLKFTSVTDSPGIIHAKNSYLQCSERLYKSNTNVDMNKYTLHPDHPEFIRAKINAQQISDKVYKASGEQVKMLGCDLRFDAIPFQTAKASREIASDVQYKESYLKERGQQVGLRSVEDDPKMVHSLAATKLQSNLEYKRKSKEERSQYNIHPDQPEFIQAKKSQDQASDLSYRHRLHDYTCDPEQLNVKHAKQAYKLQSDLNYKSDLNWIRGVGWTPPGSHKAELARRAAELGLAEGVSTDEAIANYKQKLMQQVETWGNIQQEVNMDAQNVLHNNMVQRVQKNTTASFTSMRTSSSSVSQVKTLVSCERLTQEDA